MTVRANPSDYFREHLQQPNETQLFPQFSLNIDPNMVLIVLGLVAVVGLIGVFAILAGESRCR